MQVHKNSFEGGLNTNIAKTLVPANKYIEANNVNISGINNFFALENIRGTTNVQNIIGSTNVSVLGVFASNYKIAGVSNIPCLTIFTATNLAASSLFNIWCYDTTNDTLYAMYQETFDGTNYFTSDRVIDGILYPESGVDILYFTDNYNEIRKLVCNIPSYTPNFLTPLDIKLLKHGANGKVEIVNISPDTGSLFCGSYQFAYQLCNPTTNQYTKFSLFSNPAHVYLRGINPLQSLSGVGLQSTYEIGLDITPSEEELDYYTHFRLAVIENIQPSGVNVEIAQLTPLEEISGYLSGGVIASYRYISNSRVESINLSEIVVDSMAIDTVKTLAIRENRLLGGNIVYKDLSYDNGDPVIASGSILKQGGDSNYDNLFVDTFMSSKYRGYFRDEVYRFAISYFDENGNFSYPKVLDLSSVTHNQITGAYKDMKFPARSQSLGGSTYTLFKNGDGIQSLGLSLVGIDNHPTWARGFIILRAPRIKNVLFQTPVIPLNKLSAIGAVEEYPYEAQELSGSTKKAVAYPDAQPMGPFIAYTPRNYFWQVPANIALFFTSGGTSGSTVSTKFSGEAYLDDEFNFDLAMVFQPEFMYENKPFNFSPGQKLKTVDAALVRGKYTDYSDLSIGSTTRGKNIKTSISGSFYAVVDDQYYYNSTHGGAKAAIGGTVGLNTYEEFQNFSNGAVVGGSNVFRYDKLETPGIGWGNRAYAQKCSVVKLDTSKTELNPTGTLTFAAGGQVARSGSPNQEFYITDGTLVHTIEIANVIADLPNTRYGKYETPYEFIYTGTTVTFTDSELATVRAGNTLPKNVTVWGGDCYVSPHFFKLTDTVYGVTNNGKYDGGGGVSSILNGIKDWERAFNDDTANECPVSIPVPFKNAASFIEIVLESEYNGCIRDSEIVNVVTTDGDLLTHTPIFGLGTNSENSCRVPLTYQINQNHKKQNSDKVFQLKDPLLSDNTLFSSRFIYSDQKVYQTSIVGFDNFKVLNFKDLEETHGDIHKLIVTGDDLYALQEKAIRYIGIGERTLETSDALTLSVQSGEFIGTILTIDNDRGTQHLNSVKNIGNSLYFVDNRNRTINRLSGKQLDIISEAEIGSTFRSLLSSTVPENEILTIYDPVLKQIWFVKNSASNGFCYVFDEAKQIWVSNYQFPASTLYGGAKVNQTLYLVGKESGNYNVSSMYTGNRTSLFGTVRTPSVTVSINPNMEIGKVFDDLLVSSTNRLDFAEMRVEKEAITQLVTPISLDVTDRGEGNYRAKVLRDPTNARLRGLFATVKLNWKTTNADENYVSSILTKYRISENKY